MSDEIEVTGLEIKLNGKKFTLSIEKAWELKQELDKMLHVEGVPYYPYVPYVPYISQPYDYEVRPYEITWGGDTGDPLPDPSITIC